MTKLIGKVKINYKFYDGMDVYSDGDIIEDKLLEVCKNDDIDKAIYNSSEWPILYHLSEIRGNLIEWFPFKENSSILEIGSGCGAISGFLCEKAKRVVGIELSERRSMINAYRNKEHENLEIYVSNFKNIKLKEKFDYITLIGVLEYAPSYIEGVNPFISMIKKVKDFLKPEGKIIIAIENKMGQKYLNGAKEDHVGKPFVGVEDYKDVSSVRTFSKPELIKLLKECGIDKYSFYYPVPDYKTPTAIYSDYYLPKVGDLRLWDTNYDQVRHGLYNEAIMSDQICRDGVFDYFSNSFMVVCNEENNIIKFASYTNERKEEYQTRTALYKDNEKCFIFKKYMKKVERDYDIFLKMQENQKKLQNQFFNIKFLEPKMSREGLKYRYIDGEALDISLSKHVHNVSKMIFEIKLVIDEIFKYRDEYVQEFTLTSEYTKIFGNTSPITKEKSLIITNLDMLFHNIIIKDNEAYCIDYEWIFEFPIPIEFLIYRMISTFYSKYNMYFSNKIDKKTFLINIGVKEVNINNYITMERKLAEFVFAKNKTKKYLKNYVKPKGMIEIKGF